MEGLELLGAADALADQYITFRIKNIDREKLKYKLGGTSGAVAGPALSIIDTAPKAALDLIAPIIRSTAKDYGVDTEILISNVPPSKGGRALSEFWPGLLTGGVFIGVGVLLVRLVARPK